MSSIAKPLMSRRGPAATAAASCVVPPVAASASGASGPTKAGSVSAARAKGAAASRSDAASSVARRRVWFVITASSLSKSTGMGLFPGPYPAARLVEETLVVPLAHLFAGLRRQLREERRVHVV